MVTRKRAATVSIKELAQAMQEIIEEGSQDVKANVKALAVKLGLKESTVDQKIRQAKFKYPQFRLLDLSYFVAKPGARGESYPEDELNEFFAEILDKSVEDIEAELEDAKAELEEDLERRESRRQEREEVEA